MLSFTKILVVVLFLVMLGVAFLSGSQGWWWYGMRNPQVAKEYQEENAAYISVYRTNGGSFAQDSHLRRSGTANRSFRSGVRSGRGK